MRAYVIRRVLLLIPTFLLLSILVFLSVRFLPGDAIDALAGKMQYVVGDIDREAVERMLGLDQPVYVQYGRWLGDIFLRGTLGNSLLGDWRVEERILGRLPATLELGVMAIVIGLLIGLPVGIYSAMRRNTAADYVGRSVAIIGLATPNFWLATLILTFPAIWWAWSPPLTLRRAKGCRSAKPDPLGGSPGDRYIRTRCSSPPSLILGTYLAAATMRMTRTMMLEVLRQDYVRTAWSKGTSSPGAGRTIVRHAIKKPAGAGVAVALDPGGHPDRPADADPDRRLGESWRASSACRGSARLMLTGWRNDA